MLRELYDASQRVLDYVGMGWGDSKMMLPESGRCKAELESRLQILFLATVDFGVVAASPAQLIWCNNYVEYVVLDNEKVAEVKMHKLMEEDYLAVSTWKKDLSFDEYLKEYHWYIREAPVI